MLCTAVLGMNLKVCLGVRCHRCKCVGALQYTMLIFGLPSLWVLARIKEETNVTLYVYDSITTTLSLILQYHK